jgi:HEAT repeat protein
MTADLDLERALSSADPEERRRAVADLTRAPEGERPGLLVRALGDADWRVRKEAVGVARSLAGSREVLEALVRVLGPGDNVGLRNATVEALGGFGSRAVEALREALPALDADGRKLAAEALARSADAAALDVLEAFLDDDDPNVRAAGIEAISGVGAADVDRAASLLERCLVTDDTLAALAALEGLNRLGVPVGWPLLRRHLENPLLRDAALLASGLSRHPDAAPYLVRALAAPEPRVFRAALSALATFVADDSEARKSARTALALLGEMPRRRLLEQARTPTDDLEPQRCALLVAGALGTTDAAGAVIDALSDDRIAAEAEQALDMLGPAAILALAQRARAGGSHERAAYVEQLGQLADESTRAIACQAIIDATFDGAPDVVRSALVALAQIGDEGTLGLAARWLTPESPPAIRQAALAALSAAAARYPKAARSLAQQFRPDSPDALVAAAVIGALPGPVFGTAAEDIAFLADAASNESAVVRRAALDALSRSNAPGAVEAVSFALTDEAPEVQLAAIRALGRMRDEAARSIGVGHLLEVVRTFSDDGIGVAAIQALGETGDPAALEHLRAVLKDGSAVRAVAAVEALGRIDAPGRVDALIQALSHAEPEVVKAALRAVANEERDPRAAAHVAACLDHEAWDVRRLSAELLGRRADPSTKHLLQQRLIGEREPLVREEIQRSLADVEGSTVRRTIPPLGGGIG